MKKLTSSCDAKASAASCACAWRSFCAVFSSSYPFFHLFTLHSLLNRSGGTAKSLQADPDRQTFGSHAYSNNIAPLSTNSQWKNDFFYKNFRFYCLSGIFSALNDLFQSSLRTI
jgi:hypothetical protein